MRRLRRGLGRMLRLCPGAGGKPRGNRISEKAGSVCLFAGSPENGRSTPRYPEPDAPENVSLILQLLEKKNLISLDYDKPLKAEYGPAYESLPIRGSMALTQRGQQVLEMLEYQGMTEE